MGPQREVGREGCYYLHTDNKTILKNFRKSNFIVSEIVLNTGFAGFIRRFLLCDLALRVHLHLV